jgi:hypothetical protein
MLHWRENRARFFWLKQPDLEGRNYAGQIVSAVRLRICC